MLWFNCGYITKLVKQFVKNVFSSRILQFCLYFHSVYHKSFPMVLKFGGFFQA